jgi:hypothetical protein
MDGQYSLENLRDIVLPDPPPLWPPAAEFWWLLIIVGMTLAILLFQWRRARRRNAYRRAGLALLDEAATVHDLSVTLKRVALAAFPRDQVASLYGQEWTDFLRMSCAQRDFSPLIQAGPDSPATEEHKRLAASWIRRHRAPRPEDGT